MAHFGKLNIDFYNENFNSPESVVDLWRRVNMLILKWEGGNPNKDVILVERNKFKIQFLDEPKQNLSKSMIELLNREILRMLDIVEGEFFLARPKFPESLESVKKLLPYDKGEYNYSDPKKKYIIQNLLPKSIQRDYFTDKYFQPTMRDNIEKLADFILSNLSKNSDLKNIIINKKIPEDLIRYDEINKYLKSQYENEEKKEERVKSPPKMDSPKVTKKDEKSQLRSVLSQYIDELEDMKKTIILLEKLFKSYSSQIDNIKIQKIVRNITLIGKDFEQLKDFLDIYSKSVAKINK